MLTANELRGVYAIIPTPATPDANRLDATDTVNLAETERLIQRLIKDGVAGLITLGTTGECATLTRREFDAFVDCTLEVVQRRVPVFIGTTALGAHEVADRMRFVRERRADGVLLGLPMWQPLTLDMAVDYYRGLSQLFPDLAIMVYANARAFRFTFPVAFWKAMRAHAPTVVAAKSSHATNLAEMIAVTEGRVNFMPNEMVIQDFFAVAPDAATACWATAAAMGPAPAIAMMKAVQDRDPEAMRSLASAIAHIHEPLRPILANPEVFASYNIQIEKLRMNAAGYTDCGPIRPPYDSVTPEIEAAARECGLRWAALSRDLSRQATGAPA